MPLGVPKAISLAQLLLLGCSLRSLTVRTQFLWRGVNSSFFRPASAVHSLVSSGLRHLVDALGHQERIQRGLRAPR